VTKGLSAWRVAKSVVHDAAGRPFAGLESFYSAVGGEAYEDPLDGASYTGTVRRVSYTTFDDRGRPTCESAQPIMGAVASVDPGGACQSVFTDDMSYRSATLMRYSSDKVTGRGPFSGWFAFTEVVPPDQTAAGKSGRNRSRG
jgi:hypothetical protein